MRIYLPTAAILLLACAAEPPAKAPEAAAPATAVTPAPAAAPEPAPQQAALTRVEPSEVCMVNNHFMGKPQIPVVVEGKTYFGCCEMCKSKLAQDPESRAATDPVSGARVDKAAAVIGKNASGVVSYFENENNLKQFAAR